MENFQVLDEGDSEILVRVPTPSRSRSHLELGTGDRIEDSRIHDQDESRGREPSSIESQDRVRRSEDLLKCYLDDDDENRSYTRQEARPDRARHFDNEEPRSRPVRDAEERRQKIRDLDEEEDQYPRNKFVGRPRYGMDDNFNARVKQFTPPPLNFRQPPEIRGAAHPRAKPDPYDGSDDWDTYEEHFECCAMLGSWSLMEKGLMLSAMLKGPARKFFMGLDNGAKNSYERLVFQMRQRFGCQSKHTQFWLAQFDGRIRQNGESAAALGDDLLLLARRAYPQNMTDQNINKLALQQLYKSLEVEMRWRCIERECQTIEEAVGVIETYETVMGKTRRSVRATEMKANDESQVLKMILERINKLESAMAKYSNTPKPGFQTNRPYGAPQDDHGRKCYFCEEPGHMIRDCALYKQQRQDTLNRKTRPANKSGN